MRLYSDDHRVNHRLHAQYISIRKELYKPTDNDTNHSLLLKMVRHVGQAMGEKLKSYKQDHLPDGRYYDPEKETQLVLSALQPHNDKVESVFGMNDWLSTILPNMQQATKSALIEFSYNGTMQWLKAQGEQQKQVLISLAQTRRKAVFEERRQEAAALLKAKIDDRIVAIKQAQLNQEKVDDIIDKVKSEMVITSLDELKVRVDSIKSLSIPASLQKAEIKSLVKKQIQIRAHIYHQSVNIFFSHHGIAKPNEELVQELSHIIKSNPIRAVTGVVCNHQRLSVIFDKLITFGWCKIQAQV